MYYLISLFFWVPFSAQLNHHEGYKPSQTLFCCMDVCDDSWIPEQNNWWMHGATYISSCQIAWAKLSQIRASILKDQEIKFAPIRQANSVLWTYNFHARNNSFWVKYKCHSGIVICLWNLYFTCTNGQVVIKTYILPCECTCYFSLLFSPLSYFVSLSLFLQYRSKETPQLIGLFSPNLVITNFMQCYLYGPIRRWAIERAFWPIIS